MYRLPVRPYIPNPMRCYNCQRFGHSSAKCNNPKICVCGKPSHEGTACVNVTCINCKGDHPSNSRNCPKFKFEYAVMEHKAINKCSFPEAREYVTKLSPSLITSYAKASSKPTPSPSVNISEIVSLIIPEMKKMVQNLLAEFAKLIIPQMQLKTPTSPTETTLVKETEKPSNIKAQTFTTVNKISTPNAPGTNVSVQEIVHHDQHEESDENSVSPAKGSSASSSTNKTDRRGPAKSRSRSRKLHS